MEAIREVVFAANDLVYGYSHRQKLEYFRFLRFDVSRAEYEFFPLGDGKSIPRDEFIVERWTQSDVIEAKESGALQLVEDCLRTRFLDKSEIERLPGVKREMAFRDREMNEMLATGDQTGPRHKEDIFADPSLLDRMSECMEAKGKRKRDWYKAVFLRWVALGGDKYALAPTPRGPRRGFTRIRRKGQKTGPKTYDLKRNGQLEEVLTLRINAYWLRILKMAVERFYEDRTKTPFPLVYKRMVDELCFQRTIVSGKEISAPIAKKKIPPYGMCYRHFIKIAKSIGRDVETPLKRKPVGERGGKSTDIALGVQLGDVDASYFEDFEIVYTNKGKTVVIPRPVVLFLVARGSGAIPSWQVSLGRENSNLYRFLLMYASDDKKTKMDRVGFDGDRSGIVSGEFDEICGDHGPLKQSELMKVLTDSGLGVAFPLPGTPKGKGDGEGNFSVVKRIFRKIKRESKNLGRGIVSLEDRTGGKRRRRPGQRIRITLDAFERMIIEQVSASNRLSVRRGKVPRDMIGPRFRSASPASIFEWKQSIRKGDSAHPRDQRSNASRFLKRKPGTSNNGIVKAQGGEYWSEVLENFERKVRIAEAWPANRGLKITYVVPPEGGVILWEKAKEEFIELKPTDQTIENFGKNEPYVLISFRNKLDASVARNDDDETKWEVVGKRVRTEVKASRESLGNAYKTAPAATRSDVRAAQQGVEEEALKEMAAKAGLKRDIKQNRAPLSTPVVEADGVDEEDEVPGGWMDKLPTKTPRGEAGQ